MKKVLAFFMGIAFFCGMALPAGASQTDAMPPIEKKLKSFRQGETIRLENDGYIGIPVELSTFYDSRKGPVNPAHGGTPIIVYVVNSQAERLGTVSDSKILSRMLRRGYVVIVADFKDNPKAVSPGLEYSVQLLRLNALKGEYFQDKQIFPEGSYAESFVVPAGDDVSIGNVYWEIDKHGADGTLEKIVEIWNNDFRGNKGERVIKWVHSDGSRKAVQTAFDGSEPLWLNEKGEADPKGDFIKIKYTRAEAVTDCVKPDGSPIDLNLYMDIIYPVKPRTKVPVMCLASSSESLSGSAKKEDRPQLNGFSFQGYAAIIYDFCYTPMARLDHYGYFDGNKVKGHVTGDNNTYSLSFYNDVHVNCAAMRYIRTLAAKRGRRFAFDASKIGVFGNSKGGWMTYLGEEHPEIYGPRRMFPGHHGETRYENGIVKTYVKDGARIDGGEEQPWLKARGKVLDCGAEFIFASCGGAYEYITPGHAPTYVTCNDGDPSYYGTSNQFANALRTSGVSRMVMAVHQEHTFGSVPDMRYGISAYDALFNFVNHFLKGEPLTLAFDEAEGKIGQTVGGPDGLGSPEKAGISTAGSSGTGTGVTKVVNDARLESGLDGVEVMNCAGEIAVAPDGTKALKIDGFTLNKAYKGIEFYPSPADVIRNPLVIGSQPLTGEDMGRRFTIRGKVYDTTSRIVSIRLNNCTSSKYGTADYHGFIRNFRTEPGKWTEFSFDYVVYEPSFGEVGMQQKALTIRVGSTGNLSQPIFFKDFQTVEVL